MEIRDMPQPGNAAPIIRIDCTEREARYIAIALGTHADQLDLSIEHMPIASENRLMLRQTMNVKRAWAKEIFEKVGY